MAETSSARLLGVTYILLAILAGYAFLGAIEPLGSLDPAALAERLAAAPHLLTVAGVAMMIGLVLDTIISLGLWGLLRSRAPGLALFQAAFRLFYTILHGAALLPLLGLALAIKDGGDAASLNAADVIATYETGFMVSLLFFGIHLILLGAAVLKSRIVPHVFSALLGLAGIAYIADTLALFLWTGYADAADTIMTLVAVPAVIGELGFGLWLLVFGVRRQRT